MGAGDPPPFLCLLRPSHASVGTADVAAMPTSSLAGRATPVNGWQLSPNTRDCPSRLASRPSRQRPTEPPRYMGGTFTASRLRMHAHRADVGASAPTPRRPGL